MLDFAQVMPQIESLATERVRSLPQWQDARDEASRRLADAGSVWETTRDKIARSRTSWLVADWQEPPDRVCVAPPRPMPHTVVAADGSQIVSDRHDIALCYLLNIGTIALHYGTGERVTLASYPLLAAPDDELLNAFQDASPGEPSLIAPKRLALRRQLAEFAALTELMTPAERVTPADRMTPAMDALQMDALQPPAIALYDGSLILWQLETEQEGYRKRTLQAFQTHLETARQRRVPLVGYISQPQSRDLVNALRVFHCPHQRADCDAYCPNRSRPRPDFVAPDCAGTEQITDADLFFPRLPPGARSALFLSRSKILDQYAAPHRIHFFYLHTGREVARVEIPAWVAADPELLARTHALCADQAHKGDGYPVALAEAHEQAIVRGAEKMAFFHLMERAFVASRLPVAHTQKAVAKRARRI